MMNYIVKAVPLSRPDTLSREQFRINTVESCPRCNCNYNPMPLSSVYDIICTDTENYRKLLVTFYCTKCKHSFVSEYHIDLHRNDKFCLPIETIPEYFQEPVLDEVLHALSPSFCTMYVQAAYAEHKHFIALAGIAYRCSLEYLVKDYLISLTDNTDEHEDIKEIMLGQAIGRLPDEKLKSLAKSVAWIGNDYAHYVTKHPDKDLEDLKTYLTSAMRFVSWQLTADDATAFLNSGRST